MNFGKWIVVSFVLFGAFIFTLVTVCVRQDVNLVADDYYAQELIHSEKMSRIQNVNTLATPPEVFLEQGLVKVRHEDLGRLSEGKLTLLRPSNAKLDQNFTLSPSQEQAFELRVWEKGLYRAILTWKMDGKEYHFEKMIVI